MPKSKKISRVVGQARGRDQHPPQIKSNLVFSHRYRFVANANAAVNITSRNLVRAAGYVCTTATNGASIVGSVRIKEVEMWAPPASQGAATTCSILWIGASSSVPGASDIEYSDTSVSTAFPAHVRSRPPPKTLAGDFCQDNSTLAMFSLVAPSGTIVDVDMELMLNDGATVATSNFTVASGTAGLVFYAPLDADTAAAAKLQPISLSTL